jgi:putative acetyltransferase
MIRFVKATSEDHLAIIREMFNEYADSLDVDLSFQDFRNEVASLPGDYAGPGGCMILAFAEQFVAGCVALRRIDETTCEMKRLYVRPPFRREGIGRKLSLKVMDFARAAGYQTMLLDTLPSMKEATSLYHSLGFKKRDAYRHNPIEGTLFMEIHL